VEWKLTWKATVTAIWLRRHLSEKLRQPSKEGKAKAKVILKSLPQDLKEKVVGLALENWDSEESQQGPYRGKVR